MAAPQGWTKIVSTGEDEGSIQVQGRIAILLKRASGTWKYYITVEGVEQEIRSRTASEFYSNYYPRGTLLTVRRTGNTGNAQVFVGNAYQEVGSLN